MAAREGREGITRRTFVISGAAAGAAAAQAIPQLKQLLKDEDRDVRLAAELSLRRLQGLP